MSDGARLRESWSSSLKRAETRLRSLLHSSSSTSTKWKRVPIPQREKTIDASNPGGIPLNLKGKGKSPSGPTLSDVIVHRQGDVFRMALDIPLDSSNTFLEEMDCWRSVLVTPEMRKEWDPTVQNAHTVEMFDPQTRISKTDFALGWPAYPRDAITISRTFHDDTTLIDISTSLPRSPDEPAYLRPAPPFVRSNVQLFAWCIQLIPPSSLPSAPGKSSVPIPQSKIRMTCFSHHDLNSVWGLGSSLLQNLPALVFGLFQTVKKRGNRIPLLKSYGLGLGLQNVGFDVGREALRAEYTVIPEQAEDDTGQAQQMESVDELNLVKEQRRLERGIEYELPGSCGWDVQITSKGSTEETTALPWTVRATRSVLAPPSTGISSSSTSSNSKSSQSQGRIVLRFDHAKPREHAVLRVKVVIELSGTSNALRVNGSPYPIEEVQARDPTPSTVTASKQMLGDASSVSGLSFQTTSTASSVKTSSSVPEGLSRPLMPTATDRSPAASKSILTLIRRNYIYFTSLLQEPDAKWTKSIVESRGVTLTQLDSIDPTLVVYKAEAVFVGIGLWDLLSVVSTPGARVYWDKGYDDGMILEDVNELSELWHLKTKAAWPVMARDSVLLKTSYKSPSSAHVFSFSTDDGQLFPTIPPVDPSVIRTQVDLQGWAIESLSPNTTHLTLLEQSDPKGWSNKSSISQQMIAAVAGAGEFAIKCGGPPVLSRLGGAKVINVRYDHERGMFKIDYEGSEGRRAKLATPSLSTTDLPATESIDPPRPPIPLIECELRCDSDTWSSNIEVVVDPPPQSVSCLKRHRFSSGGGGLWITISHDAIFVDDDPLSVIVRKGPSGKERGIVMVNGAKTKVDVEDLPDHEVKALAKTKRIKPQRIPLDQPPVLTVLRRRRAEWDEDSDSAKTLLSDRSSVEPKARPIVNALAAWTTAVPTFSGFFAYPEKSPQAKAVSSVVQAPEPPKVPMECALKALSYLHSLYSQNSTDGWTLITDKLAFPVYRKVEPSISTTIPVHKGEKVVEGVSAEEVAALICDIDSRRYWDDRFDSATVLEEFGAGCHTSFVVTKAGFPFRDRGFYVASLTAHLDSASQITTILPIASSLNRSDSVTSSPSGGRGVLTPSSNRSVIFCLSTSYSVTPRPPFSSPKCNPYNLPMGRMLIYGWILETLDPYTTTENYAIPSTRCTHVASIDLAGSVPIAYNSMVNSTLPKTIVALEAYLKNRGNYVPRPMLRLPAPCLEFVPEKATQGDGTMVGWKLERVEEERKLLGSGFDSERKLFKASIFIRPGLGSKAKEETDSSSAISSSNLTTPRPSQLYSFQSRIRTPVGSPSSSQQLPSSPPTSPTRTSHFSTPQARRPSSSGTEISKDFVVGEVVVDTRLFENGYEVSLKTVNLGEETKPLSLTPLSISDDEKSVLPFVTVIYTIPSSALLINTTSTRHLLRFMLPTSVYTAEPLLDPLTGETRLPPTRPMWLEKLEKGGAVVEVFVKSGESVGKSSSGVVNVDGVSVEVVNEKKSSLVLGRWELEDGKGGGWPLLSRIALTGEGERTKLPEALLEPVAVAKDLFEDPVKVKELVGQASLGNGELKGSEGGDEIKGDGSSSGTPLMDSKPEIPIDATLKTSTPTRRKSTFNLFDVKTYPNSFLRSGSGVGKSSVAPPVLHTEPMTMKEVTAPVTGTVSASARPSRMYPLHTVVFVALVAFLVGSLLRSLLSPADFIYIADGEGEKGAWREVKRLVEIKYIFGGWDFIVAVVRRPD